MQNHNLTINTNQLFYNPKEKYYFISVVYCGRSPAWIRRPFQTKQDVDNFLKFEYMQAPELFTQLEIYDESLLRELIHVKDKQSKLVETDIRSWLFDDTYSSQSIYYKSIINGDSEVN
jgi:hypothetical protein